MWVLEELQRCSTRDATVALQFRQCHAHFLFTIGGLGGWSPSKIICERGPSPLNWMCLSCRFLSLRQMGWETITVTVWVGWDVVWVLLYCRPQLCASEVLALQWTDICSPIVDLQVQEPRVSAWLRFFFNCPGYFTLLHVCFYKKAKKNS